MEQVEVAAEGNEAVGAEVAREIEALAGLTLFTRLMAFIEAYARVPHTKRQTPAIQTALASPRSSEPLSAEGAAALKRHEATHRPPECRTCGIRHWDNQDTLCERFDPVGEDEGYPVESCVDPDAMTRPTDPGPPSIDDPDLRALAELRAMGPARLVGALRSFNSAWSESTGEPYGGSELIQMLREAWGPRSDTKPDLRGLAAREAQADDAPISDGEWLKRVGSAPHVERPMTEHEEVMLARRLGLTQQAPIATGERPIWEMVIEEALARWDPYPNKMTDVACEIVADMRARHEEGARKYGRSLTLSTPTRFTPIEEAYHEALDRVVYLRQAIERGHAVQGLYDRALNDLVAHKAAMRST